MNKVIVYKGQRYICENEEIDENMIDYGALDRAGEKYGFYNGVLHNRNGVAIAVTVDMDSLSYTVAVPHQEHGVIVEVQGPSTPIKSIQNLDEYFQANIEKWKDISNKAGEIYKNGLSQIEAGFKTLVGGDFGRRGFRGMD